MSYQIGMQQGRMELTRIVTLLGLGCNYPAAQGDPLPPVPEQALLSGSWYDPTHNGEGFNLEMLADDRALVYWFSYDKQGNRRWFFGIGEYREGKLVFEDMLTSSGGVFGPDFDPDSVEFKSWGTLEMELTCNEGTVSYSSSEDGFGSGTLNLIRLTTIETLGCP